MAELAFAVVGLAVAVPTIIEPTVRSIRFIRETLHKYKSTDSIQSRLVLQLDLHLVQIENLAIFIYGTTSEGNGTVSSGLAATLDPTSQAVLRRVVHTLGCLMDDFVEQLTTALDVTGGRVTGRVRRLAFAFRGRSDPLHQLLQELESWERSFSNVVFSACLAAGRRLPVGFDSLPDSVPAASQDTTQETGSLSTPIPLPVYSSSSQTTSARVIAKDLIELIQKCCISSQSLTGLSPLRLLPRSPDTCVQLKHSGLLFNAALPSQDNCSEHAPFFLETHISNPSLPSTDAETRRIAAFLHGANPKLVALLPCEGFYVETTGHQCYNEDGSSFMLPSLTTRTLVFRVPKGLCSPRSLRDVLLEARSVGIKHPLDERLALMKKLASALLLIHTAEHIHKSIRADNVVLLQEEDRDKAQYYISKLGEPFLVGFDLSRQDARHSDMTTTTDLHKTYYLPVDRQGDPIRRYSMLDDIYSLGVLFLEIALWQSLVQFQPGEDSLTATSKKKEGRWVGTDLLLDRNGNPLDPSAMHRRLVALAYKDVARRMGTVVSGLIVSCLTCLDGEQDEDGNEWTSFGKHGNLADQDGIVLGQAYIRKVIMVLDTISF